MSFVHHIITQLFLLDEQHTAKLGCGNSIVLIFLGANDELSIMIISSRLPVTVNRG
jgi:hypothetical protein